MNIYIYIYVYIYIYIHVSIHQCVHPSMHPSLCSSVYLSIYYSICLSIYLSTYLSSHLSIYVSIYLSIYLSICLSIYVSIYPSMYPSLCHIHLPSRSSNLVKKFATRLPTSGDPPNQQICRKSNYALAARGLQTTRFWGICKALTGLGAYSRGAYILGPRDLELGKHSVD